MIAVIFEAVPQDERAKEYLSVTGDAWPFLDGVDGCLGVQRFESLGEPGRLLAVSLWRDEDVVRLWQNIETRSRKCCGPILRSYRIRIAEIAYDSAAGLRSDCDGSRGHEVIERLSSDFSADARHALADSADSAP